MKDGQSVVAFVKVDNYQECYFSVAAIQVQYTNFDILGIVSYAARFSAFNNNIYGQSLTKVYVPLVQLSVLDGEDKEPLTRSQ